MVYRRGMILLLLTSFSAWGSDQVQQKVAEMESGYADIKRQARVQAIEEQQNRYCTEELKMQLSEVLKIPPNPRTGNIEIPPYQAWKLEETYKTCSELKNPSKTTKMLLDVVPRQIRDHVAEERAAE